MIFAPGVPGVVFGSLADGDGRLDGGVRSTIADALGISSEWATISQVHGARVVPARRPGHYGDADGIVTTTRGLPIVVGTADCVPIALVGRRSVSLVHAGWRGIAAGIVRTAAEAIEGCGDRLATVVMGPHIGPCCYEVGQEVIDAIGGHARTTTWNTMSADLGSAIRGQVDDADVISVGPCTMDDLSFASHRRDRTPLRQVAIAWIP